MSDKPRVHNTYHRTAPPDAVYVGRGRGSSWGNPFAIGDPHPVTGEPMNRAEAVWEHREWLLAQPDLVKRVRAELAGKHLVCFCFPAACHGDTLFEVANALECVCCLVLETEVAIGKVDGLLLCLYCQPCPMCNRAGTTCSDFRCEE
jgi:hypothetical protein